MSDHPATRQIVSAPDAITSRNGANGAHRLRNWLASPIGRAVSDVLPDVVRLIGRRGTSEPRSIASHILPSTDGANGMSISEVEVDVDAPFIRRVVIRSASSWSVAPEILKAEQRRRRGRFGLSALTVSMLGIAGVVFARRNGISLPGQFRLPAGITRTLKQRIETQNPDEPE